VKKAPKGRVPVSNYTVCWVPIGPEISVACQTLEDALALADELVAIGKTENIRVLKNEQAAKATLAPHIDNSAVH
jgi:hypothetical protein